MKPVVWFAWSFLVLWCGLSAAQTGSANVRWPFQPSVIGTGPGNAAASGDSVFNETLINQSPLVLSVDQIIEGTLSPDEYIVGPGDGFRVNIWGKRSDRFLVTVTPEGMLLIPQVGELAVAGLTLRQLRERLDAELRRYFYDIRMTATLIQLRSFQVYILGEVNRPGVYAARAVDRVSQLIAKAGGLRIGASARAIQIQRDGNVVGTADLLRFAQEAALSHNPYVKDGDVLFVPHQTASVTISGAVWEPGVYELREEDTVEALIRLANGLKPAAIRTQVELVRFNPDHVSTHRMFVDLSDTTDGKGGRMPLLPDDRLFVRSIPKWHEKQTVILTGEVRFPGPYVIIQDSTTLTEVMARAGGFTPEASLVASYVLRQDTTVTIDKEFERLKLVSSADMTPTEYEYFKMKARERPGVMVVNFKRLFNDHDQTEDITLKDGDRIVVPQNLETVNISGQVAVPGAVVFEPTLNVSDYIAKAGGFAWNARRGNTRVIKAKTGEWLWAKDVRQLDPGDTIWVPERPNRDWWGIFIQGIAVVSQAATVYLLFDTVIRR